MPVAFDAFLFDEERRELRRDGAVVPIEPQAFDVLRYLIENRDRAIGREELLSSCWPGVHVSDGTLSRCLTRVRAALDQKRGADGPIKTLHARGYRFVAAVRTLGTPQRQVPSDEPPDPLAASPAAALPRGLERRLVTALSCAVDPAEPVDTAEDLHLARRAFVADAAEVAEAYRAAMLDVGDGRLTMQFGYPATEERAIHNAFAVAERLIALAPEHVLSARVGLASGRVVVDPAAPLAAAASLRPETLISVCRPNEWLVDPVTARLAGADAAEREDGAFTIQTASVVEESHRGMPLFGRVRELTRLEQLWRRADRGIGGVALVTGEAGIGKSRLVFEIAATARTEGATVVSAAAAPLHAMTPFHPVLAMLRTRLDLRADATPVQLLAALEDALAHAGLELENSIPLLSALLAVGESQSVRKPADAERRRDRMLDALVALAASWSDDGPALIIFDDHQWSDPSTCELVERLAERTATKPLLLVVGSREPSDALATLDLDVARIEVERFTDQQTKRFLESLSDAGRVPFGLVEGIRARSEGVPLYLREFLRMARDGAATLDGVPETLQSLLEARLAASGDAIDVAYWAALLGREFSVEELVAVCGDAAGVEAALHELERLDLVETVRGAPDRRAFHHALLQQSALLSMLDAERRRRNRMVGGKKRSYHLKCQAVDFRVKGNNRGLSRFLRSHPSVGGFKRYASGFYHIDTGPRRTW